MTVSLAAMRWLIALVTLMAVSPALGQSWGHYANARFAYAIDVPPDFEGNGESDNGDGQNFYNPGGEQGLTVWGAMLTQRLADAAADAAAAQTAQGWNIIEQSSTPDWAILVAMRDHRLRFERMILLCDGQSFAAFQIEYNIGDSNDVSGILDGLSRSFVPVGC